MDAGTNQCFCPSFMLALNEIYKNIPTFKGVLVFVAQFMLSVGVKCFVKF